MDTAQLKPLIEAMIFVADEPLTEGAIIEALSDAGVGRDQVRECIAAIEGEWNADTGRGIGLSQVAGGYQFRTKEGFAEWLRRMNVPKPMRLSGPALETLAIAAYRQPITKGEIERIRGVDSGAVLKTLLERRLLRIVGRREEPGQPLLYGTTREFLEIFNLKALTELPTLKDIEELMRERRALTENQPGEAWTSSAAGGEEEEARLIEGEEDEEETEVIRRRPGDEDEDEEGGEKDMEALADLTQCLKDIRRLERGIFPKPPAAADGARHHPVPGGGGQEGGEAPASKPDGEGPVRTDAAAADEDRPDAPPKDDSPFE